ncbi:hypothetical protein ABMC89_10645 [Sulfitobacter sp. HNIBRBA3233]|uniref:hypothetical protein n=1 Tax=Sulfitobacter marinivivus TaxID=3158558 RepID=UPI0032DEB216
MTAAPLAADPATINNIAFSKVGGTFTFNVTIAHPDSGWEHYVDAWRVKDLDGNVLGTRQLAHPHVEEQPFTRSLSNVEIPADVDTVLIEVHDNTSGWGPDIATVKIR